MEYGTVDLQAVASINCGGASRQISAEEYMIQNKLNNPSSFTLKIPYEATLIPSDKTAFQGEILVQRMDGMFAVDSHKPIVRSCLNGMPFHFVPDNTEAEDEINVLRVKIGKVFKQMEHKLRVVGLNKYTTKPDEDLVCVIAGLMTTRNNSLFPIERGDVIIAALPSVTRGKPQITNSNTSPHRRTMEGRPLNEHTLTDISDDEEYLTEMAKTKEFGAICQMVASYASTYVLRAVKFQHASEEIRTFIRNDHDEDSVHFMLKYGEIFTKEICRNSNEVDEDMTKLVAESLGSALHTKILSDMEEQPKMEGIARDIFTPLRDIGYLLTSHVASRIIGVAQSDAASNKEFDIFIHPPQNLRRIPVALLPPAPNKDNPGTYGQLYDYLPNKFDPENITNAYFMKDKSTGKNIYTGVWNDGYRPSKKFKSGKDEGFFMFGGQFHWDTATLEENAKKLEEVRKRLAREREERDRLAKEKEEREERERETKEREEREKRERETKEREEREKREKETKEREKREKETKEREEKERLEEEERKKKMLFGADQIVAEKTAGINLLSPTSPKLIASLIFLKEDKEVKMVYTRCISALIGIVQFRSLYPIVPRTATGDNDIDDKMNKLEDESKKLYDALLDYITNLFSIDKGEITVNTIEGTMTRMTKVTGCPIVDIVTLSTELADTPGDVYKDYYLVKQTKILEVVMSFFSDAIMPTEEGYNYAKLKEYGYEYVQFADIDAALTDAKRRCWHSGSLVDIFVPGIGGNDPLVTDDPYGVFYTYLTSLKDEHIPFEFDYAAMGLDKFTLNGKIAIIPPSIIEARWFETFKRIVDCINMYDNDYASQIMEQINMLVKVNKYELPTPGNVPPLAYVMTYVYAAKIQSAMKPVILDKPIAEQLRLHISRETTRYGENINALMKRLYENGLINYNNDRDRRYIQYILNKGKLPLVVDADRQLYLTAEKNALKRIDRLVDVEFGLPDTLIKDGCIVSSRCTIAELNEDSMKTFRTVEQPDFSLALAHIYMLYSFISSDLNECKIAGVTDDAVSARMYAYYQSVPAILDALVVGFSTVGNINYMALVQGHADFQAAYDQTMAIAAINNGAHQNFMYELNALYRISQCMSTCIMKYISDVNIHRSDSFAVDKMNAPDALRHTKFLRNDTTHYFLLSSYMSDTVDRTVFTANLTKYMTASTGIRLTNFENLLLNKDMPTIVNVYIEPNDSDAHLKKKVLTHLRCYEHAERLACYTWARGLTIASAVVVPHKLGMKRVTCYLHTFVYVTIWEAAKQIASLANANEIWDDIGRRCFTLIGCETDEEYIQRCKNYYPAFNKAIGDIRPYIDEYKRDVDTEYTRIQTECGIDATLPDQEKAEVLLNNMKSHTKYREEMVKSYTELHQDFFDKITA